MNKKEFFAALRRALAALPDEERDNVIKYYEDYFLDAEGESEEEIIRSLGDPARIAESILRDYRELAPRPGSSGGGAAAGTARRRKGVSPWALLVLVLVAVPLCLLLGIPVAGGLAATAAGLLAAAAGVLAVLLLIPAGLALGGVLLCFFSFFAWAAPASAALTLGVGLVLLALGGLAALLLIKLLCLFLPPIFRGLVAALRWVCRKIRGLFR